MRENKVRIRTYRQVWRLEQVIYQIERVRLPFPVTFRQIGVFGTVLMAMMVISRIPPLGTISPVLRYALIPGVAAWYFTGRRLDGKLPHRWALSMLSHWFGPKHLSRLKPIANSGRLRMAARVSFRVASDDSREGGRTWTSR